MVCVGCVQQWQLGIFLGWLLTWCALPGPALSAPASVVQSTAVFTDTGGSSNTSGIGAVALPSSFAEALPTAASDQSTRVAKEGAGAGADSDDKGNESTHAPGVASSTESGTADDGEAEHVVSLVPLFVLLASFLLVIVSCVVVCQRIRNSHKSRFHREEQDYRVQSAAYQLIASDGSGRQSTGCQSRLPSAANGKCGSLDNNGNIRSTLVKFVDTTGLAATVVTCVQAPPVMVGASGAVGKHLSTLTDRRVNSSSDCRDGCGEDAPLLQEYGQFPQEPAAAADASTKAVRPGEVVAADTTENKSSIKPIDVKAPVAIVASATAANEQGRKSCLTPASAAGAGGTGGAGGGVGSSHCVTFAEDDLTAAAHSSVVPKTVSLKSFKRSPPPPSRNNFGVDAAKNVTFHVMDGKSLKVAFLDKSLTVHGPDGRNFKVARMQSLPNSSSTNALSALHVAVASPPSARSLDAIRQQLPSGGADGFGGTVAAAPHVRHRSFGRSSSSNRPRAKKHSVSSSSPNSSSVPSSPRDQQPLVTFDRHLDGADEAVQPPQSLPSAVAAARAVNSIGVKKRDSRSARARRGNRPLSAAPRLVGAAAAAVAGTRAPLHGLRWKLPGPPPFGVDDSYEPDDGEDTDDSDVGVVRKYQRRRTAPSAAGKQRQLSSSVGHRANILDSGGSGSCNS